jgi:hypothetical protein
MGLAHPGHIKYPCLGWCRCAPDSDLKLHEFLCRGHRYLGSRRTGFCGGDMACSYQECGLSHNKDRSHTYLLYFGIGVTCGTPVSRHPGTKLTSIRKRCQLCTDSGRHSLDPIWTCPKSPGGLKPCA